VTAAEVAVVGSVNLDIVIGVPHHPVPGETVLGGDRADLQGGKGANQAVAAARLGRSVAFVGRVGDDAAGALLRDGLRAEGVDVAHLGTDPGVASGVALIAVAQDGENTIIVSPGANGRVQPADVAAAADVLAGAAVMLLQHEVPAATVLAAARTAGGTVVLNPAPARATDAALLELVGVLVPNRGELAVLAGRDGAPEDLARGLHGAVVVTLGDDGVLVVQGDRSERIPAPTVDAVDTTGAGDAFCGALADALARGAALVEAARWAVAAAALSVTAPGARGGMPDAAAVAATLR
jgi:ribokinase